MLTKLFPERDKKNRRIVLLITHEFWIMNTANNKLQRMRKLNNSDIVIKRHQMAPYQQRPFVVLSVWDQLFDKEN